MTAAQQQKAAKEFAAYWQGKGYEKGESQPFWLSLLRDVYGVEHPEQFIEFEDQVHLDHASFIDGYIPATRVLIEQKALGKDMKKGIRQSDGSLLSPFQQAKRYITELPLSKHPRWVITCNFSTFFVYDMERPQGEPEVIELADLEKEYYRLQFLVDTGNDHIQREMQVSIAAGEIVGLLYDAFAKQYADPESEHALKSLNKLCVRLVFCFYAEDAGIFGRKGMFHDYLAAFDTRGMRRALVELFKILDTEPQNRDPYLKDDNPDLAAFPYVNGGLFADEDIEIPPFTDEIRDLILTKASEDFNWSEISPTIFGAVFESTLNPETRRHGGMHYTSIENIHKVIDPLFLDDLKKELDEICAITVERTKAVKLRTYQRKLASLTFLDPACGSGNFLTETYLSLRRLENRVLLELAHGQVAMYSPSESPIQISISQFYGIEINDFAVTVAKTALWIAESQMMKETEKILLVPLPFLPLKTNAYIVEGNALRMDWETVVPKAKLNYIMGNPPFNGARTMSKNQKDDMINIVELKSENPKKYKNFSKNLDYVAAWYFIAARYINGTHIKVGFVSTSSICQGEQVYPLWNTLINDLRVNIDYAYTPYKWESESQRTAQVFVTIIGFSMKTSVLSEKKLFVNNVLKTGTNISPYLILAPSIIIKPEKEPISISLKMAFGNQPRDGGNLILSEEERKEALKKEPNIEKWILPYIGSLELIKGTQRYCLWLKDAPPQVIAKSPFLFDRVKKVQEFRLNSKAKTTNQYAKIPARFAQVAQPESDYLAIPEVSTSKRKYIPMGFFHSNVIASNKLFIVPNATLYHFGILESNIHMAWMRLVAGRLGDGYNYSKELVYNTFPWPSPSKEQQEKIEQTAQAILDARKKYSDCSLSDLYGDNMVLYSELIKAHQQNDKAVLAVYGITSKDPAFSSESACVTELVKLYQQKVAELDAKQKN